MSFAIVTQYLLPYHSLLSIDQSSQNAPPYCAPPQNTFSITLYLSNRLIRVTRPIKPALLVHPIHFSPRCSFYLLFFF